jgi:putative inorganic carbon (HCO3(-)) transporter
MRDILVLAVALIFLISAFTSRFAGAVSYWWFSIFRPHEYIYIDVTGFRLTLVATVLFVVPSILQGKVPSFRNPITLLMISFLFLGLVSSFTAGCTPLGFRQDYLFDFTTALIAILFTIRVVETVNQMFFLILIIALVICFHAGKAGLQSLLGVGGTFYGSSEMGGMFSGSNAFALGSAVLLFFVLNVLILSRKQTIKVLSIFRRFPKLTFYAKYIISICIVGIVFNVISLSSRGSALSMFAGIAVWFWLSSLIRPKTIVIGCVVIFTLFSFFDLPEGYSERLATAFVEKENLGKSAASRPHFWNIAVDMTVDYPLGVGPGCYNTLYNLYDYSSGQYGFSRTVHSSHFEVLAEVGFLGSVVWLALFIVALLKCFKMKSLAKFNGLHRSSNIFVYHTSIMLFTSLLVYFIGGSFYALAYNPILWLLFGMVVMLSNIQKSTMKGLKE